MKVIINASAVLEKDEAGYEYRRGNPEVQPSHCCGWAFPKA